MFFLSFFGDMLTWSACLKSMFLVRHCSKSSINTHVCDEKLRRWGIWGTGDLAAPCAAAQVFFSLSFGQKWRTHNMKSTHLCNYLSIYLFISIFVYSTYLFIQQHLAGFSNLYTECITTCHSIESRHWMWKQSAVTWFSKLWQGDLTTGDGDRLEWENGDDENGMLISIGGLNMLENYSYTCYNRIILHCNLCMCVNLKGRL